MSRVSALRCDWPGCTAVSSEAGAKRDGWLCVGGNKRGRYRGDICTVHVRHLLMDAKKVTRKKP